MEDKSIARPYFETSMRKEFMILQLPNTRYTIEQVVPMAHNKEDGTCVIVYKKDPAIQQLVDKFKVFPAAWSYWYLKKVRLINDACVNQLMLSTFSDGCLAEAMNSTWCNETWVIQTPHTTVANTYLLNHVDHGIDIDHLDMSQMLENKAGIDQEQQETAVTQVTEMYRIKEGDATMNSNSGASAKTGATGTTGGDNRSICSVTSTDVKTNYKRNAVALAKQEVRWQHSNMRLVHNNK